ncbi:hypothetical protein ACQEVS_09770 [Streptomyces sp. CA-181903]|uniref:hypothetical protein n=1 Tax=Streptomyces sp. CA-181903 TaxID=3240055 RepID=UPI003D91C400
MTTMAWDSVPWFTEGGAEHSSEIARVLAFAAFSGAQGIIGGGDLRVQALGTPAAAVQVMPGAAAILNRSRGSTYEAYAARLPAADTVPIAGTGASARSDLIIARVENPYSYGETWPQPKDAATGPYVFTRVISGVPKTTTDVREVRPNDSAITLARIDIPANTSAITGSMIKSLREMANPRRRRVLRSLQGVWDQPDEVGNIRQPAYEMFPDGAKWMLEIPDWASSMTIMATWAQLDQRNAADSYGFLKVGIGGVEGQLDGGAVLLATPATRYLCQYRGGQRYTLVSGGTLSIPRFMRGGVWPFIMQGSGAKDYKGLLEADGGSAVFLDVEFVESPHEDQI